MNTKKFIQILAVSATALITACEEELTSFDCETPITVTSQVSETTRAGYEGTTSLPQTFVMDVKQGSENYDYSLVTMTRDGNTNTYKAPANMLLLWKGTDHSTANVKAMTIPYGVNAIDANNAMTVKVYEDQTNDANVKASDLLGAKTGDGITINGNAINIEFRHLMSKLYVNYTMTNNRIIVNSITLKNTCVKGDYSYKDMNYVNSPLGYGDITMFHNSNSKAAEAIFYPYTPTNNPQLEVSIRINGVDKTLTCPIQFKDNNNSFEGGKKYIMNIRINGTNIDNSFITIVKDWTEDNESIEKTFADKKILWIGTSIPAEDGNRNYPTMIAEALGCTIINNAIGGSFVNFYPNDCNWTRNNWTSPYEFTAGTENITWSLSATHKDVYDKYHPVLDRLAKQKGQDYKNAIDSLIRKFQGYSYESLIIPYITGSNPCNVVIIDHGYNDREYIGMEAFLGRDGNLWLQNLIEGKVQYSISSQYRKLVVGENGVGEKFAYISAMNHIIQDCKQRAKAAGNDVQFIIGNYFSQDTPQYSGNPDLTHIIPSLLKSNEAVAAINDIDIVNVYQHIGLYATNDKKDYYDQLFNDYCTDGTHPASDPHLRLSKIIAQTYIEELRKILNK